MYIGFQTCHKCVSGNQNIVLGPFICWSLNAAYGHQQKVPLKSVEGFHTQRPDCILRRQKKYSPLLIYSLHRAVDILFYLALDNLWFPVKSGKITLAINSDLFMCSDFIWHSTQLCLLSWNNNILCFSRLSSLSYLEINLNCPILS